MRPGRIVCCFLLVATACTERDGLEISSEQPGSSSEQSSSTTSSSSTSTTMAPATTAPDTAVPVAMEADPPLGETPGAMIAFDSTGARRIGTDASEELIVSGPVFEIADDGAGGVVFQRDEDDGLLWWLPAGETEPRKIVETSEERQFLTLEGVVGTGPDRVVLYQLVHRTGSPETTEATLLRFNVGDESGSLVTVTGGWESISAFSSISGRTAVSRWMAEGQEGMTIIDLATGQKLYDTYDAGLECFDGSGICRGFEVAALHEGWILGVGTLWNEDLGLVDRMALSRFDPETAEVDVIASFPWDNGFWYPENLFLLDGTAVISRSAEPSGSSFERTPLAPIAVDLETGDAWVIPETAFVRPVTSASPTDEACGGGGLDLRTDYVEAAALIQADCEGVDLGFGRYSAAAELLNLLMQELRMNDVGFDHPANRTASAAGVFNEIWYTVSLDLEYTGSYDLAGTWAADCDLGLITIDPTPSPDLLATLMAQSGCNAR